MQNMRESAGATRIEKDALGPVAVPRGHLAGAQTQRAIENSALGRPRFCWDHPVIRALGVLKKSAALANRKLGALDSEFPLIAVQTGSGTRTNMNANGIIASRAIQLAGGYEKAAEIALKAHREGSSLRAAALALDCVSAEQFALWVRPPDMVHPQGVAPAAEPR